jgi:hypothetical protein
MFLAAKIAIVNGITRSRMIETLLLTSFLGTILANCRLEEKDPASNKVKKISFGHLVNNLPSQLLLTDRITGNQWL